MKDRLITAGLMLLLALVLSAGVWLQYRAFKQKYPGADVWTFIVSGGR